ncbi:MAG: hypothetical protein JOY71_23720 [Acetobacteraceae bacterium]|nr:hypothetical protein [Acetobacteraceae bacterium]
MPGVDRGLSAKHAKGDEARCRVEVAIFDAFVEHDIASAVEGVRSAAPATWTYIGEWARIRRIDQEQDLLPLFDSSGTQMVIAGNVATQGDSTFVITR